MKFLLILISFIVFAGCAAREVITEPKLARLYIYRSSENWGALKQSKIIFDEVDTRFINDGEYVLMNVDAKQHSVRIESPGSPFYRTFSFQLKSPDDYFIRVKPVTAKTKTIDSTSITEFKFPQLDETGLKFQTKEEFIEGNGFDIVSPALGNSAIQSMKLAK